MNGSGGDSGGVHIGVKGGKDLGQPGGVGGIVIGGNQGSGCPGICVHGTAGAGPGTTGGTGGNEDRLLHCVWHQYRVFWAVVKQLSRIILHAALQPVANQPQVTRHRSNAVSQAVPEAANCALHPVRQVGAITNGGVHNIEENVAACPQFVPPALQHARYASTATHAQPGATPGELASHALACAIQLAPGGKGGGVIVVGGVGGGGCNLNGTGLGIVKSSSPR